MGHALLSDQDGAQPPGPVRAVLVAEAPYARAGLGRATGVPTMTSTAVNLVLLPGPS